MPINKNRRDDGIRKSLLGNHLVIIQAKTLIDAKRNGWKLDEEWDVTSSLVSFHKIVVNYKRKKSNLIAKKTGSHYSNDRTNQCPVPPDTMQLKEHCFCNISANHAWPE